MTLGIWLLLVSWKDEVSEIQMSPLALGLLYTLPSGCWSNQKASSHFCLSHPSSLRFSNQFGIYLSIKSLALIKVNHVFDSLTCHFCHRMITFSQGPGMPNLIWIIDNQCERQFSYRFRGYILFLVFLPLNLNNMHNMIQFLITNFSTYNLNG